jgi:hypothetical protein
VLLFLIPSAARDPYPQQLAVWQLATPFYCKGREGRKENRNSEFYSFANFASVAVEFLSIAKLLAITMAFAPAL